MDQRLRHASYIMHVSSVAEYVGSVIKMRDAFTFAREFSGIGDTKLFAGIGDNAQGGSEDAGEARGVVGIVQ